MTATWSREAKLSVGLLLAFIVVIVATFYSYQMSLRLPEAEQSAEHSLQLLGAVESLVQVSRDMDRGAFDYALRKDFDSLRRYQTASAAISPLLDFIKAMAPSDGKQQAQIARLQSQLNVFQSQCSELVKDATGQAATIEKNGGTTEKNQGQTEKVLREWKPSPMLNLIHSQILSIKTEEKARLQSGIADAEENKPQSTMQSYASLVILVALFFCVLLLLLLMMLNRQIRMTMQATEAERRFSRQIVEHAPIGIINLDNSFTIRDVNSVFCRYLNLAESDIISKVLWDLVPTLPRNKIEECMSSARAYLEESAQLEMQKDGEVQELFWDIAFWPILDGKNVKGIVAMVSDVTERINLANHKQVLMQTITHDLKSPLLAGSLILQALTHDTHSLDARQKHLITRVRNTTDEALRMVKNILEVARYSDAADILTSEAVDLNDIARAAVDELKMAAASGDILVNLSCSEAPCPVRADPAALHHMMLNLLDNAIKFSPPGGHVSVTTQSRQEQCIIEVSDQGPGIPQEHMTNIFEAFWQSEAGKKVAGGTGVGLYLCKQIVKAFGGSITCQSAPGETTFSISLPTHHAETEGSQQQACTHTV